MPTKATKPSQAKTDQVKKSTETTQKIPGKDMATAGFAVAVASIFTNWATLGLAAVAGLVLSIIGRIQTSKAGHPSSLALAGIIISAAVMAFTFLAFIFLVTIALLFMSHADQAPADQCSTHGLEYHCQPRQNNTDTMPYYYGQGNG